MLSWVANEDAFLGVWRQPFALVFLYVHIGKTAKHSEVGDVLFESCEELSGYLEVDRGRG